MNSPKYRAIVEWTVHQIASGKFLPGDKFLSETALGQRFGFSRQTVRRALELLEQGGYVVRIHGSGTYIAANQPSAGNPPPCTGTSSRTVGILSTHLDDYIFPGTIRGIEAVLTGEGYTVQLASTKNLVSGETRALQRMLESPLAGLIVEPTKSGLPCLNLDLYQTIAQRGIPLVCMDAYYAELPVPYVALDDQQAGYVATEYLLSMGHRHIAGIFTHSDRQGHLRYLGYAKALVDRGVPLQDERVHWYSKESLLHTLHGSRLAEGLATCTAVLCFNDQLAVLLMELCRKNGRLVPDALSVVGVDDSNLAKMNALTSVAHPMERLGDAAARLLISMIHGAEGKSVLFPPQLMVRGSVRRWEG